MPMHPPKSHTIYWLHQQNTIVCVPASLPSARPSVLGHKAGRLARHRFLSLAHLAGWLGDGWLASPIWPGGGLDAETDRQRAGHAIDGVLIQSINRMRFRVNTFQQ